MKKFKTNNNRKLMSAVILLSCSITAAQAEPLPVGSVLTIETGNATGTDITEAGACTIGSCVGMEVNPGFWIWTNLSAGTDGGLVIGKNQLSGGQEHSVPGATDATPGEMTDAWLFFGEYGTFYADNSLNVFSDTSNDGTTALNDFNVAWNGVTISGGSLSGYARPGLTDYTVTLDGVGGDSYSLDYTFEGAQGGCFCSTPVRVILRGQIQPPAFVAPTAGAVTIDNNSGLVSQWIPDVTGALGYPRVCSIVSQPVHGEATIDPGCVYGTYQSNPDYTGTDSFTYSVTSGFISSIATVSVNVSLAECNSYPIQMVTTEGGGQSLAVNNQLVTTFTGHLTTEQGLTSGAKNKVTVCPGATVEFDSVSTVGTARCSINGVATAAKGTVTAGDKLICSNKPDGSDIDRFSVKNGL